VFKERRKMGTNYYAPARPDCDCCGRGYEPLHIGKSSGGWKFLFAPYPDLGLTSWKAWKSYLESTSSIIEDEYGQTVTLAELIELVESKQRPDMLDATSASFEQWGPTPKDQRYKYETADDEGYRFSTTDDFC
jgi:hypothetical protein